MLVKTITCEQAHHFEWRAKLAVGERVSERVNQGLERRSPAPLLSLAAPFAFHFRLNESKLILRRPQF